MVRSLLIFFFVSSCLYAAAQSQSEEELNNKGLALMEEEKYKEALPYFEKLIEVNPEATPYRYNRAVTLFNLKQYHRALLDYIFLIDFDKEEPEYLFQIGNIYEHLDSLKKLRSIIQRLLK